MALRHILTLSFILAAQAAVLSVNNLGQNLQKCIGIHGGQDAGRGLQSGITLTLDNVYAGDTSAGNVSIIMFELGDEHLGGLKLPNGETEYHCTEETITQGLCEHEQLGEFLVTSEAHEKSKHPITTTILPLNMPILIEYPVDGRGYYCAAASTTSGNAFSLSMKVVDRNHNLPGFRQGTLNFYRTASIISLIFLATWLWVSSRKHPSFWPRPVKLLVWISTMCCLVRWAVLESADHNMLGFGGSLVASVVSTGLLTVQDALVVAVTLQAVQDVPGMNERGRFVKPVSGMSAAIFLLSCVIDSNAQDADKLPAMAATIVGTLLAILCIAASVMANRIQSAIPAGRHQFKKPYRLLCGCLVGFGACFAFLAAINIYILQFTTQHSTLFGSQFWTWRGVLMDLPYEPLLLIMVCVLVVFFFYKPSKEAVERMEIDTVDDWFEVAGKSDSEYEMDEHVPLASSGHD